MLTSKHPIQEERLHDGDDYKLLSLSTGELSEFKTIRLA